MALNIVSGSFALPKQIHASMLGGYMENDAVANSYAGLPVQGQNGATAADVTAGAALGTAFLGKNSSILQAIEHAASSTTYSEGPGIDITAQEVKLDFAGAGDSTLPAHTLAATSVFAAASLGGATGKFSESELAEFLAGTVASTGIAASAGVLAIAGDGSSVQLNGSGLIEVKDGGVSLAKMADLSQGSLIVGGPLDAPTALDAKGDGKLLIGNGTDLNSVEVTGDVTLTNAGVSAIGTGKVLTAMLADDAVTPAKMSLFDDALAATDTHILIADGTDYSSFAMSGDVTLSNAGVSAIGAGKVDHAMLNADVSTSGFTFTTEPVKFDTDILRIKGSDAAGNADQAFSLKVEGGILVLTDQGNF